MEDINLDNNNYNNNNNDNDNDNNNDNNDKQSLTAIENNNTDNNDKAIDSNNNNDNDERTTNESVEPIESNDNIVIDSNIPIKSNDNVDSNIPIKSNDNVLVSTTISTNPNDNIVFDSRIPPIDPRYLTLKNLDTGEEFIIGENDPDFEWDTFEIGERRTDERLSDQSDQKDTWLQYIYSFFYTKNDTRDESVKSKRIKTPFTKLSSFKMRRELGRGAFGRVLLAEAKIDNKLYALKIISKKTIRNNADRTQAKAERDILHAMSYSNPHPFTLGLKFAFQSTNNLYLGMDFLPGGNLRELIRRHKVLPESWVRLYSAELVLALAHLHSINVLYRDIKPHNVMIDARGHVIIIDFGLSKWDKENYKNKDRAMSLVGTPDYSAPEVLKTGVYQIEKKRQSVDYEDKTIFRNRRNRSAELNDENYGYGKAADWWSLGIMIYEMLSGVPAFRGADLRQTYQKVLFSELEFRPTELFSEPAKTLLVGLLDRNPETRLGAGKTSPTDIQSAEFFKGIDWKRVLSCVDDGPWIPEPVVFNKRRTSVDREGGDANLKNEVKDTDNNQNEGDTNTTTTNDNDNHTNEDEHRMSNVAHSESNATIQMRESIFSASMNNQENKLQGWSFFDEQALAHAIEKNNEKESKLKDLLL